MKTSNDIKKKCEYHFISPSLGALTGGGGSGGRSS